VWALSALYSYLQHWLCYSLGNTTVMTAQFWGRSVISSFNSVGLHSPNIFFLYLCFTFFLPAFISWSKSFLWTLNFLAIQECSNLERMKQWGDEDDDDNDDDDNDDDVDDMIMMMKMMMMIMMMMMMMMMMMTRTITQDDNARRQWWRRWWRWRCSCYCRLWWWRLTK
jgi:hypothetical protein